MLRSGVQLAVGPPHIDTAAVASKGPIIHGSGVRSFTHNSAAAKASSRVNTTQPTGCTNRRKDQGERMGGGREIGRRECTNQHEPEAGSDNRRKPLETGGATRSLPKA